MFYTKIVRPDQEIYVPIRGTVSLVQRAALQHYHEKVTVLEFWRRHGVLRGGIGPKASKDRMEKSRKLTSLGFLDDC